ncbi:MAG TPA: PadR family transcriptional regulator [Firmicutes bacterium]|nr:PadR family transcriptional regulator [Candidatus Fermentithermobacillaceae bacterium]
MRVNKELSKGTHEIIILELLSRKDMHGYELVQEMELLSDKAFSMSQGSLYPLLHVMESKRYIDSYEETVNGRKRRCYTLTDKGRSVLAEKKNQWKVLVNAMERILGRELGEQS